MMLFQISGANSNFWINMWGVLCSYLENTKMAPVPYTAHKTIVQMGWTYECKKRKSHRYLNNSKWTPFLPSGGERLPRKYPN